MKTDLDYIPAFTPARWSLNGHVHTIVRSLFSRAEKPPVERLEIPTPDEDFLELDLCEASGGRAVITLFHGMEGSADRYYITELMSALYERGCPVVAINFRGCGSKMNRQRRFYHSGETGDFAIVFNWIRNRFSGYRLGAVGFSLGGNALLKSLGEAGTDHPLDAATAVSVPYDLGRCSQGMTEGFNRIYQYQFLSSMEKKLEAKRPRYPDLPQFSGSSLYEYDN